MAMELVELSTVRLKRRFMKFVRTLYSGDPWYVDTSRFLLKMFLYRTDSFTKNCFSCPVAVLENGTIIAQCILIHDARLAYLQVGFFDALPGRPDAVALLIRHAKNTAVARGTVNIVIGLNGHVSYGVGILRPGVAKKISFDSNYNKPYYGEYFETGGFTAHTLSTYVFTLDDVRSRISPLSQTYKDFSFRTLKMGEFEREMHLFGTLCNICLRDTFLYFERAPAELFELMSGLKPFLRPEYLIFALHGNREIGFFFWHPDFNAVLPPGRKLSLPGIYVRNRLFGKTVTTVKVNAIGILPEFRRTGVVAGLFDAGLRRAPAHFRYGETNFVWDCNRHSRMLNLGLENKPDRSYAVYTQTCG
jgi:hypothetical protein